MKSWKVVRSWSYTASTEKSVLAEAKAFSAARSEDGEGVALRLARFAETRCFCLLEMVES